MKQVDTECNKLKNRLTLLQNKLKVEKDVFLKVGIQNEIDEIQAKLFDIKDQEGKK